MGSSKRIVVGNWKMELSHAASIELARALAKMSVEVNMEGVDVVVCPSFVQLSIAAKELQEVEEIIIGAQNIHFEDRGAWTGEVSVKQIEPFVKVCIVGHSEQRFLSRESDEAVARKTRLLLAHSIVPIVCVGETEEEREEGRTIDKVSLQVEALFNEIKFSDLYRVVIAYEPIWAIGSGNVCEPSEAASIMLLIRKLAAEKYDQKQAQRLRIIYGGSVSAKNARSIFDEPGIDGVLVGGASIHPADFLSVVESAYNSIH